MMGGLHRRHIQISDRAAVAALVLRGTMELRHKVATEGMVLAMTLADRAYIMVVVVAPQRTTAELRELAALAAAALDRLVSGLPEYRARAVAVAVENVVVTMAMLAVPAAPA